ncbi:extracellular solute-binding protein [Paenibacillus thalictri]|uniref:Extracellular solute-binding protein n=1 Tax=Paenibacillus thalictri TaxID=2527873 RepID=A0A4V2J3M6_9BACL|nr:extracellular solute-binding protein [Paenibacillus thalictri]TBL73924.1 extracellular solute-binding protein [Paenibacillus thalictri]
MKKKLTASTVIVALAGSLLAGCQIAGKDEGSASPSPAAGNNTAAAGTAAPPSSGPVKLSYWVAMPADAARSLKNFNEALVYQEMEKRTGVKIDFMHPAVGSETEQFNLMIASGKLPDIIENDFTRYPGGPEKAISDKVLIKLNDVIDKYAPNLKKFLNEHPNFKKEIVTDDGSIYVFPGIGIGNNAVSSGLVLRKDWLNDLGLAVPETMDEWTNVLRQFKEKKGSKAPFTLRLADLNKELFNGAYGIGWEFYMDNGKVKYGPYEAGYKDYLTQMSAWYKEGLIDPDFATQDAKSLDAKITNNTAGALTTAVGGGIGKYLNAMQDKDPKYDLVGAPYPVLRKGDEPKFINKPYEYRGGGSAGITTSNKNVAETAKWLDYFYSDEGHMLKSFGVEGQTYNMVNGYPKYTDLITKNPDKLSIGEAMGKYLRVAQPSPGLVGDDRYADQYFALPQQKEASAIFSKHQKNADAILLPRITQTPEEASELSSIMAEVNTYQSEMFLKFVMGAEPIGNFDKYKSQLKSLKIERAIELKQAALERYNKRK